MGSVSTHFATSDFFGNQYLWIDCSEQEMAYKFLTAITYSADFQLSKNFVCQVLLGLLIKRRGRKLIILF